MKPITIFALSIVLGLSLVGCKKPNADTKGKEAGKEKEDIVAIPVKIAAATTGPISSYLEFDSILETESAVEVHPESSGLVVAVMAEVGDTVEAGQLIAQLENEEQEVNVRESLSRYQHLQSKFKRTEDLFKRNLINQQE
jgi:multidrug efflux pump subunit AcrA (membrane-fusion protein)